MSEPLCRRCDGPLGERREYDPQDLCKPCADAEEREWWAAFSSGGCHEDEAS